jgi:hypothetical protein
MDLEKEGVGMFIRDVITTNVVTIPSSTSLADARSSRTRKWRPPPGHQ